uniref:MIZ/SP-RING zinc finger containing protein, putative n=1 Tax=Theileria annulata TaxID=5874 RepID=A0A3B0MW65_THEAN
MVRKSKVASITNDYYYCICSGSFVVKDPDYKPLVCKLCSKYSHRECTNYSGKQEEFECLLCKIHLLDPFNTVDNYLWYECIGNTTSYFVVDATNLRKWRSNNKDIYMACIPLNKEVLQHEWPKTFQLKINNDMVHVVKEPSWEHKRRDNPIKVTYAMRTGENLINITSTTYTENEPLFLLVMFVCNQVTVHNIIDTLKMNHTIPYEEARDRIYSILNTKIDDDEIVCMENTFKMDLICPVTLDKITIPTRGRFCGHIQCYDLFGYLKVMERTSAFNMRWKCPECHLIVKPYDLVIDTYVEKLIVDLPNVKTIQLDKDLNYRIILDLNNARSSAKTQSDDDQQLNNDEDMDYVADLETTMNSTTENVIELESDGQNVDVICISDDDVNIQEPVNDIIEPPKTPPTSRGRPRKNKIVDKNINSSSSSEKKTRKRKLKKPTDGPDSFAITIADKTLADCVNTFNQQTLHSFTNSTPSYDNFILKPPVINQMNKT